MRPYYLLFFIPFFCVQKYGCQNNTFSISLFYEINQIRPQNEFYKLDSICNLIKANHAEIKITGFADYLSNTSYNQTLSEKRAFLVKNYLEKRLSENNNRSKIKIIACTGEGEKNSLDDNSNTGEPYQRRVDVFIAVKTNTIVAYSPVVKVAQNLTKDIKALAKGERMTIEGLLFEPGRHVAFESAMPVLVKLVETLKKETNLRIEIQGHVCCFDGNDDGFDYDNLDHQLSVNRAKAVYDYLIKNGIEASRLTYKGYGYSDPKVFPEITPQDEQMNRRVEVKVLDF
jgi:outer membrane protein OmpA-like peptidoglycan-associated protein